MIFEGKVDRDTSPFIELFFFFFFLLQGFNTMVLFSILLLSYDTL